MFASVHAHGDARPVYEAAGQSVLAIEGETTVAEQMARLTSEMHGAWARLQSLAVADR